MSILDKNWLTEPPHDYELKEYRLLSAIQQVFKEVENGRLYYALEEVERNLYELYKFEGKRGELEDKMKILKGINLDTMSLEYEYPEESEELLIAHKLTDLAIDEFEAVFKYIRSTWRQLSGKIVLTEVPSVRPTKTKGQVFVTHKDSDTILIYEYTNIESKSEWRSIDLVKIGEMKNELGELSNYIQNLDDSDNYRFWRCNHTIKFDLDECVMPLIKYNLFFKIISA